ncbi:MAG TPA: site-specific DNA-methyltransferase [Solirubrobacterales bacterium]
MSPAREKSRRGRRRSETGAASLVHGECAEAMASMGSASVEAVVTDPPYGIDWQGERWDGRSIRKAVADAGGGGMSANEAFEVWCESWARECLRVMKPGAHLLAFGSPRTWHRLTAGLEDAGFEIRDTLMWLYGTGMPKSRRHPGDRGTTLKPAFEPIVLARKKPVGTVADNVRLHGTGLLEVGGCRVSGRYPADVVISHESGCEDGACAPGCPVAALDRSADAVPSRFFYCPKASRAEREAGCDRLDLRRLDLFPNAGRADKASSPSRNPHPTVKPLTLMRWLVRLATPPGGTVLDPFTGSGTTGVAAALEGLRFRGIEREAAYLQIAAARIGHWSGESVEVRGEAGPWRGRRR